MQLAWMRHQPLSPAPARVLAVAGLQADLDRPLGHVVAEPRPPLGAARAGRLDSADLAAKGGLDHHPRAVLERAYNLVAGDERVARQRVEGQRRVTGDRRPGRTAH